MRNFYLTLILVLSGLTLFAQGEYPFLTEGKQWVQNEFYSDGSNPSILSYFEFTLGDTTRVDGTEYVEAFRDTTVFDGETRFSGLLRETDGRLLILRNGVIDTLMDFNINVGDTVYIGSNFEPGQHMLLLSIDSITIFNGSIRKRLNFELNNVGFDGGGFAVSWIDGIGSTRGTIFNSSCSTNSFARFSPSCQSELICVKDADNRLLYNSTEDEIYDCNKVDVISSVPNYQLPDGAFKLYPNPASNFVFIEGNEQHPLSRLIITDMSGRKIIDRTLTSPTTAGYRAELSSFRKGIYNITVFTPEGKWSSLRVVKQ